MLSIHTLLLVLFAFPLVLCTPHSLHSSHSQSAVQPIVDEATSLRPRNVPSKITLELRSRRGLYERSPLPSDPPSTGSDTPQTRRPYKKQPLDWDYMRPLGDPNKPGQGFLDRAWDTYQKGVDAVKNGMNSVEDFIKSIPPIPVIPGGSGGLGPIEPILGSNTDGSTTEASTTQESNTDDSQNTTPSRVRRGLYIRSPLPDGDSSSQTPAQEWVTASSQKDGPYHGPYGGAFDAFVNDIDATGKFFQPLLQENSPLMQASNNDGSGGFAPSNENS